jgi:hypothetical protein
VRANTALAAVDDRLCARCPAIKSPFSKRERCAEVMARIARKLVARFHHVERAQT